MWDETPIWMPASGNWPSLGDKTNDILKQCLTHSREGGVRSAVCVCWVSKGAPVMPT